MAYSIIAQTNSTTTLADENGNVITVPSRSILDAGTTFTLVKINNNTATLEDSNGKVYRDIPCCIDLTQVTGFNVTKVNNNKATLEDGDGNVYAGVPCVVNLTGTGGGSAVIETLNVTPSTSAQTITASGGTDGYSPVNVSAVDASIDANITAGNIKSGVTILGVTGNVVELNGETVSVTPTTSSQTITPTSPKNAFTEISVSAVTSSIDANIQAGNIKKDVTILGVTGTYEAGGGGGLVLEMEVSSGTLQHSTTANSVIDLTGVTGIGDFAMPMAYANNTTISGSVDLSGITSVGKYSFYEAFLNCTNITGNITISDASSADSSYAFNRAFKGCTGITSATISSSTISGATYALQYAFQDCTGITSIDVSGITTIGMTSSTTSAACAYVFKGCTGITTATFTNLSSLGRNSMYHFFDECTNLASLYFPAITTTSFGHAQCLNYMLYGVDNCTLHFPSNVQSVVEAQTGYSTTAPFGATAGTVLFDLPATS